MNLEALKFPVGKHIKPETVSKTDFANWINDIKSFPALLNELLNNYKDSLEAKYRPDGWNIAQVVHHCADSHMNAYVRFKLSLTEENPTIKPYMEDRWAELTDSKSLDITPSIKIIEGLHYRWAQTLENMSANDWERTYYHPDYKKQFIMKDVLALYAWHSRHHLAHIENAIKNPF